MTRRRFSRISEAPRLQNAYTRYKQWQDREEPLNTPRDASSNPGGLVRRAITPFGLSGSDEIIVRVSRRAAGFSPLTSAIGTSRASADLAGANRSPGFDPAKVVLFVGTGSEQTPTSRITGLRYRKRVGVSYTHAFGASTATEREMEAQDVIANALLSEPHRSVSFQPERRYAL